jgi:hypothetical protein
MLMHTRAQGALLSPGPHTAALRELLAELMDDSDNLRRLVDLLHGCDVRIATGDGPDTHPLAGAWAPELTLIIDGRERPLSQLMHGARPVLLDLRDDGELRTTVAPWRDRVDVVTATCPAGPPADALLIRPDGYVAWAGRSSSGLERSLRRWFGTPHEQPDIHQSLPASTTAK